MAATAHARRATPARAVARGVLVVACLVYAAAKFTGAQFVLPGYLHDSPVADLSGMDLTWAFFARSPLYSGFVAAGQLVAAALLAFDRTARLGAVVLLPITANIAVVNLGYDIGRDTLALSLFLLALNVYLLAGEFPALRRCFWAETAADPGASLRRAVVARAGLFSAAVVGTFLTFAAIMSGPAGGQRAIAGDWVVESASVEGRPTADPALGGDWLWVSFDPTGLFGVRTKRHTFRGKYDVDPATGAFAARYDPEPLPPNYPGPTPAHYRLTDTEQQRLLGESLEGFRWPVELAGTYRRDGDKLIVTTTGRAGRVEWVLVPYKRPKF
jgi:uncharacterized membrane protein